MGPVVWVFTQWFYFLLPVGARLEIDQINWGKMREINLTSASTTDRPAGCSITHLIIA